MLESCEVSGFGCILKPFVVIDRPLLARNWASSSANLIFWVSFCNVSSSLHSILLFAVTFVSWKRLVISLRNWL